jgi:hypothetical protein
VLLHVAFEVHFSTWWKKTLASFTTTTIDDGATAFGSHTSTESVLLLACAL